MSAATLPFALERLKSRPVEVHGQISIGAGRGDDMGAFLKVWPDSRVLLVEMDPRFEAHHAELARSDPRFSSAICAAAAQDGEGAALKTDQFGGALAAADTPGAQAVRIAKIDTLVAEHGLQPPYFLKFDTHGAELDILAGAAETLKQTALVMMEVYNFKLRFTGYKNLTFDEMSLHMKSLGFRCADIVDPLFRPADNVLWQLHMLFLRDDHPVWQRHGFRE